MAEVSNGSMVENIPINMPPQENLTCNESKHVEDHDPGYDYIKGSNTAEETPETVDNSIKMENETEGKEFCAKDYQDLKIELANRPLWVSADVHINLKCDSEFYSLALKFLMVISEPVYRFEDRRNHTFKLTPFSLYAALSSGLEPEDIINYLTRLCSTRIPELAISLIKMSRSYGKAKLIIKNNRYVIESQYPEVIQKMLNDAVIRENLLRDSEEDLTNQLKVDSKSKENAITQLDAKLSVENVKDSMGKEYEQVASDSLKCDNKEEGHNMPVKPRALAIKNDQLKIVHKRCIALEYPLSADYDFRNDLKSKTIDIALRPSVVLRPFQKMGLRKMFFNGLAHSGTIVLPCGAGKSLVGVAACCTVRKRAMIICNSGYSVEQWKSQFKMWTTINEDLIFCFTSELKGKNDIDATLQRCNVMITTYHMVASQQNHSAGSTKVMDWIQQHEWGIMILDEVHMSPAPIFRQVMTTVQAHCNLGLTATLVREDDKINDLEFFIGPKLYEANMLDLQEEGYIARVKCTEVLCPMDDDFQRLCQPSVSIQLLSVMNPNKFRTCQYLIKYHEQQNHKIMVFSDNVYALKHYAVTMNKRFIYGRISQKERKSILDEFKTDPDFKTLFVSRVADTSFDMPDANVLIQISSHGGSRRQELQRLGRINRAKNCAVDQTYNAYFYTLVSQNTLEVAHSKKRKGYLAEQGYTYEVIKVLDGMDKDQELHYNTKEEQMALLELVHAAAEKDCDEGHDGTVVPRRTVDSTTRQNVKRKFNSCNSVRQNIKRKMDSLHRSISKRGL